MVSSNFDMFLLYLFSRVMPHVLKEAGKTHIFCECRLSWPGLVEACGYVWSTQAFMPLQTADWQYSLFRQLFDTGHTGCL